MSINAKFLAGSLSALGVLFFLSLLNAPLEAPATPEKSVVLDAFGVDEARYQIEEHRIVRNQTFSTILATYGVDATQAQQLAQEARPLFDVRHLRAGKDLRIYQDDSLHSARLVIYQPDPVRYVVFDLRDSLQVYEGRHPVTIQQRQVQGTIASSLYQTLDDQGADPALAIHLSKVFAWQIDFYRIRQGDSFQVVYEEHALDGAPVGSPRIIAARFTHAAKDFYAFNFGDDGKGTFYDEQGNSLRQAFLKAPLDFSRISSRYSKRRFHPVQKRYKPHLGTDYAAATGTPIHATSDGIVTAAAFSRGNGRYVKIKHNETYTTGYLHMSRIAKGIKAGRRVRQGDVIGYVGSTGLATGPHLCYRFWKNGVQIDPLKLEIHSAEPINVVQRDAFFTFRDHFLPLLQPAPQPPMVRATVQLPAKTLLEAAL